MSDEWVTYLDSLAAFGMRPGLDRVEALLDRLGRPERLFKAIHVVGTNGKSSTTRYAAAILAAHGSRSAAYLSPHITGYPERVLVDGRPVGDEAFGAAVEEVRGLIGGLPADLGETTQYEVLTVAALLAMARAGVRTAAVEAGLGGRLDATNVLHAPVVVLTNIGLEHTDVLGDTREQILAEKVAVIHGGDAVFGGLEGLEQPADAHCTAVGARAHHLGRHVFVSGVPACFTVTIADDGAEYRDLAVMTPATYQVGNAALAVAAVHYLLGGLRTSAVRSALAGVVVPGRLQVVGSRPLVVADGAHNPHGMAALAAALPSLALPRPTVALLGMLADKDVDGMLRTVLPLVDRVVCTRAAEPRSLPAAELAERAAKVGGSAVGPAPAWIDDPVAAYDAALAEAGREGSVLITGSLYLLEDLAAVLAAG